MSEQRETRRQWFTNLGRYAILGGLAVLTTTLVGRDGSRLQNDCTRRIRCGDCALLQSCRLPKKNA